MGRRTLALLLVLSVALSLLYFTRTQTVVFGYDPLGYLYAGQRLAQGGGLSFPDANNALAGSFFAPFAYNIVHRGDTNLYLNYPPGFPLLLALAQTITGAAHAPYFVTPFVGIVGILTTYWLGKRLFGDVAGLMAAALLGLSPLFFTFSTDLWSDVPATVCLLIAMALYVSSVSSARWPGTLKAAAAGLMLGYAVLIRYSAAIFVLPLGLYGVMVASTSASTSAAAKRRLLMFLAAFAVALFGVLLFNKIYYGGFLATAYSSQAGWYPWPAFSLSYALGPSPAGGRSLIAAGQTLLRDLPLALLFGGLGLFTMKRSSAVLLGGTFLAVLGLYACYAFAPAGINARFLLPAVPMICLAAAAGLERARLYFAEKTRAGILLPLTVIALSVVLFRPTLATVERRASDTEAQIRQAIAMTAPTPENAVFMSYVFNDLISYYGNRSVLNYRRIPPADVEAKRYKMENLEPCLVAAVARLLDAGRPVYYVEDKTPPFWDSLAILQRHFRLRPTPQDPKVYQVIEPIGASDRGDFSLCTR